LGDIDLVRALGLAGLCSVVVAEPHDPAFHSRFTCKELSWAEDHRATEEHYLDVLMHFGSQQPEPPVLFYEADWQLLLVSRYRKRLERVFRFVIADAPLVEDLVNKARFQQLASRLNLPVPASRRINASQSSAANIDLRFPLIIKPAQDEDRDPFRSIAGSGKALLVETPEDLRELWPLLAEAGLNLLFQEGVQGPESAIESYHVYVGQHGTIVAEFTGRKIRTFPVTCGPSTALETTDAPEVRSLGRTIVQMLGLRGVAKLDFKRAPDGRLYLLEINPRFNLWHHLGAVAGVNLPALVYADLLGLPRPTDLTVRAGVRWVKLWADLHAARASGVPVATWLFWAMRCEAKSIGSWNDPMPFLRRELARIPLVRRALAPG
jgi:predicted ATP-grasp superfamily ATP-dependent carboligase